MSCFKIRDLGELKSFVGTQIMRSHNAVHIHQKEYIIQILGRLGFTNGRSVRTPLDLKLVIAPQEDECPHDTRKRYQEMGWIPYVARDHDAARYRHCHLKTCTVSC